MADPRLLVTRDAFALRALSDEALRRIVPTLIEAQQAILAELAGAGDDLTWFLTRRLQTLAAIDAQLDAVADRLANVLSPALVDAYQQGAEAAEQYVLAVAPPSATPAGALAAGGQIVPVFNPTVGVGGFTITEQQLAAVAQGRGFGGFPGLGADLPDLVNRWKVSTSATIQKQLESGFLLSRSTGEITREVLGEVALRTEGGPLVDAIGRRINLKANVEAVVRTSMATASQAAHDAFTEANADVLGDDEGNRYRWDATNDGRLCPICAPLDDTRYPTREAVPRFPAHFNCRCRILPITAISDQLDPGQGSFLESVKAEKGENGKWLPAPDGYTGGNAYKQRRKINGEWRWVRRRDDLPAGRSTAGEMLLRANDETRHEVLGSWKRVEAFKLLTAPGRRFHGDPQGAVIELLRPGGLPPGATRRLRPTPARR